MTRPWMQFHTRDWLDNKELRRCSPVARAVLSDLMCLAHEGNPYGYLRDDVGALEESFLAARCVVSLKVFRAALIELLQYNRIELSDDKGLFISRMVRDEEIRIKRAAGGIKSVDHPNTYPCRAKQGYPSTNPSDANEGDHPSRVSVDAHSDSDSGISSSVLKKQKERKEAEGWFESEFWPLWPVKANKKPAKAIAWKIPMEDRPRVLGAVKRQSRQIAAMERPIHAATWINGERWEDQCSSPQVSDEAPARYIDTFKLEWEAECMAKGLPLP